MSYQCTEIIIIIIVYVTMRNVHMPSLNLRGFKDLLQDNTSNGKQTE